MHVLASAGVSLLAAGVLATTAAASAASADVPPVIHTRAALANVPVYETSSLTGSLQGKLARHEAVVLDCVHRTEFVPGGYVVHVSSTTRPMSGYSAQRLWGIWMNFQVTLDQLRTLPVCPR